MFHPRTQYKALDEEFLPDDGPGVPSLVQIPVEL